MRDILSGIVSPSLSQAFGKDSVQSRTVSFFEMNRISSISFRSFITYPRVSKHITCNASTIMRKF